MISILKKTNYVNIVVSVAIKRKDKYLLVKEAKKEILGLWNFPSGKVNFGEDLFTAAKREAKEESGYDCKIMGLSSINFFYWDDTPGLTIRFNFLGKISSSKQSALAKDISQTSWFDFKEIEQMDKNNLLRSKATIRQYQDLKKEKSYPKSIISKICNYKKFVTRKNIKGKLNRLDIWC